MPDNAIILAKDCLYAARNNNETLTQLQIDGSIAMFSYTDALVLFTSTIILIVSIAIRSSNHSKDQDRVETAQALLSEMREYGNKATTKFHKELKLLHRDLGFENLSGADATGKTIKLTLAT